MITDREMRGASWWRTALLGGIVAVPALWTGPVAAQTAAESSKGGGIEEIFVTARKRQESFISAPVADTVISKQDLDRYASTDLVKISQQIPQVTISQRNGAGQGGSLTIRGISSAGADTGIEAAVLVNIDGVGATRGVVVQSAFFDVQQVEILKGPQALFFGKNSPAGVVSLVSVDPSDHFEGYARGGYEVYAHERYFEGAVGGPVTPKVGLRIAARIDNMRGWVHNIAQPGSNAFNPKTPGASTEYAPNGQDLVGRITLDLKPSDRFSAKLKVFASDHIDHSAVFNEAKCAAADAGKVPATVSGPVTVVDPTGDCELNGIISNGAIPLAKTVNWPEARDGRSYTNNQNQMGALTLDYDLDKVTLTSVSSFYHYDFHNFANVNITSSGLQSASNFEAFTQGGEELRLLTKFDGQLNFMFGGYYEKTRLGRSLASIIANLPADPRTGQLYTYGIGAYQHGHSMSFFGQAIWKVTDKLELDAGARWTLEKKDRWMAQTFKNKNFPSLTFLNEGIPIAGTYKDDSVSPEATLSYHPSTNSTLYVAYKTGYQSGGFSIPASLSTLFIQPGSGRYGPEIARGEEIGAKGTFFDDKLFVNATVYRYTFRGLQVSSFNAALIAFDITNAASARTSGAELALQYAATNALQLRASVGYNRARYVNFTTASCYAGQTAGCVATQQNLSGQPLARAPDWTAVAGFTYDVPITAGLGVGVSNDIKYTSSYNWQENRNPLAFQEGFILVDAGLRLHDVDNRWEFAVIGKNLTNKFYGIEGGDQPLGKAGTISVVTGRSRQVIAQGTVHF